MSKILAVFGATGQQGGSIINYVLNDPELSTKYKIRAITRDVNSEKAKQLTEKIEVVQGDVLNRTSLETALTGAHTVFAMTTPSFGPDDLEVEYNSAKATSDVAVEKGAEYIIFSTLPSVKEISGGKYTKVTPFDAKAKAEEYIRGLHIKSAFYSPGSFMENFQSQTFLAPQQASDGTWVMARHTSPKSQMPLIDAVGDTGKFVGAILAEPDKYEGKTFCAATALYSLEEIAAIMSKATGKTVVYKQIPLENLKKSLSFAVDIFVEGFSYGEEFGYFGPDSKRLVAWAAENARGRLSTFEEQKEPCQDSAIGFFRLRPRRPVPAIFNTTAGAVYSFDDHVAIGIGSAMPRNARVAAVYDMPGANPNIAYGDGFGRALWKGTQNPQAFMDKLAKSMRNAVRTSAPAALQTALVGETYINQSFVHVRWAWIASPAAMLLVALVFFVGSIWQSSRTRAVPCHAGKEGALVLLTVELDEKLAKMARGPLARPGELAKRIGDERVILEDDWGLLVLRRQE